MNEQVVEIPIHLLNRCVNLLTTRLELHTYIRLVNAFQKSSSREI